MLYSDVPCRTEQRSDGWYVQPLHVTDKWSGPFRNQVEAIRAIYFVMCVE